MFGSQQPQNVVLLRREIVLREQFFFELAKAIVGAPQVEEHLLGQRVETWLALGRADAHASLYSPLDNCCPDTYLPRSRGLFVDRPRVISGSEADRRTTMRE